MVMAVQRGFKGVLVRIYSLLARISSVIPFVTPWLPCYTFTLFVFPLTILPQTVFPTKGFYLWFIEGSVGRASILFYVYSHYRCYKSQVCVGVSEVQTSHWQPSAASLLLYAHSV
jgi:hypothetical protein